MNTILYFPKDKMICRIAGYTAANNTTNVLKIIESLQKDAQKFAEDAGIDIADVHTHEVTKSTRYKNMRIFFAVVADEKGEPFRTLSEWTMTEWIEY